VLSDLPTMAPVPRPTLGRLHTSAYSVGHVLNDLAAAVWFSFMLVIFTNVQRLSKNQAGALMLIGQVRKRRRRRCTLRRRKHALATEPAAAPPRGSAARAACGRRGAP